MKYCFELFLKGSVAEKEQWQQFFTQLTAHIGYMTPCEITMRVQDSVVRFFVEADKDLGVLSNNIDLGVLRPVSDEEAEPPKQGGAERFVTLPKGNLIDLREKMMLKRGKELEYAVIRCRRINVEKTLVKLTLHYKTPAGTYTATRKTLLTFPAHLLSINFEENSRYLKKKFPKYINIEKALPVLSPTDNNALLSVSTFPYFANDYYLNLQDYEFDKHSFIIGASGSGKSKFIELLVDRISKSGYRSNYRILVIDPHASLGDQMKNIPDSQVIDFSGDSAPELFGDSAKTDVSASTELTTTLMKSLLADQFNPKVERVLRFSLYVLFTAQTMSLGYLKRFLTELELRNQIMQHVSGSVPPNIEQFFATDYNEIRTTFYTEAVLPIISLVDEMQLQPGLVGENELSLAKTIQNNYLTVFSLNKVSMGEKVVKTAAGILMQQIFLLAQARSFNEKVIMIVDEVSVVQSPALAAILSEARKYNLFVILTQQYFGQVEKSLKDAIFANVYNYYVFRVSEEDAEGLVGNLNIDIPKEIIESEHKKGIKEETIKKRFMTELHPRECLVRISANGQIVPVFKAKTLDIGDSNQGLPKADKLEEAEAVDATPKLKKFKEGESASMDDVPEFKPNAVVNSDNVPSLNAPDSNTNSIGDSLTAPSAASAEITTHNDTSPSVENFKDLADKAWDDGPARSSATGRTKNPEQIDEVFFNNYEIDPVERQQAKEGRKNKAAKVAKAIAKGNITLQPATPMPVSQDFLNNVAAPKSDPTEGYGRGNLASLLSSQSSSRELVNKEKV